ncbi:MAG: hypothetical protein OEV08_01720 [Nitrospira sp.]|nr:hypothetical protein [Nitrospira sp.]
MGETPNFRETISIQIFWQVPGVPTNRILANCLFTIDKAHEVNEIVSHLNLKRLFRATQRKATNWLNFRLRNGERIMTDLDQEAGELRVTTEESVQEYKISEEALKCLNQHIQKARPLYEKLIAT